MNGTKTHPLGDRKILRELIKNMSKKDLIFLVMILFFTFILLVIALTNMPPFYKFLIIIGMFILIALYISKKKK